MTLGYFGRPFNAKHKSLTTKTHIVEDNKVLCGYKPHKTLSFQWCIIGLGIDKMEMIECKECKKRYLKIIGDER